MKKAAHLRIGYMTEPKKLTKSIVVYISSSRGAV